MGCLLSSNSGGGDDNPSDSKPAANRQLQNEVKLLLLGPGESGKTTIFKVMQLLQNGFQNEEKIQFKHLVYMNIISQMKMLIRAAKRMDLGLKNPENIAYAKAVEDLKSYGTDWTPEIGQMFESLWRDKGIQATYSYRDREFQLNDSAAYFFDNLHRINLPGYIPTEDDILRCRVKSTGIEEAVFTFGGLTFRLVDVGGQRNERKKWVHCFEDVTAVMFCVALSEYDQALREDPTQNRTHESLLLFQEICNSRWFQHTPIILFLNKTDLFREKIRRVALSTCFADFKDGADYEKAVQFFTDRFLAVNKSPNRPIYVYLTCAVQTASIKFVFSNVQQILLKNVLDDSSIPA